jgi:hypothetical protein
MSLDGIRRVREDIHDDQSLICSIGPDEQGAQSNGGQRQGPGVQVLMMSKRPSDTDTETAHSQQDIRQESKCYSSDPRGDVKEGRVQGALRR